MKKTKPNSKPKNNKSNKNNFHNCTINILLVETHDKKIEQNLIKEKSFSFKKILLQLILSKVIIYVINYTVKIFENLT